MEVYKDIILIFLIITVLFYSYRVISNRIIMNSSKRYSHIVDINDTYTFHKIKDSYTHTERLKTKQQFDRYNYHRKLKDHMASEQSELNVLAEHILENKIWWLKYQEQLNNVPPLMNKESYKGINLPFILYHHKEKKMCQALILKEPKTNPKIIHKIRYTSPKGQNDYQDKKQWQYNEVHTIIESIRADEKRKQSKEYQRSLVTPGVRYDVLQRDQFKCVLCNASAEQGVALEVDHIKPVAKGGLSTMENLRTLCKPCNRGKSDKYDPQGVN